MLLALAASLNMRLNAAGTWVNFLLLRVLRRLLVLQRQLVPHFVGNLLLYVRRQLRRSSRRGGAPSTSPASWCAA